MEVHHKKSRAMGGTDDFKNLVFLKTEIHKLIHSTHPETQEKLMTNIQLTEAMIKKINSLRKKCGNKELDNRKVKI